MYLHGMEMGNFNNLVQVKDTIVVAKYEAYSVSDVCVQSTGDSRPNV